MAAKSKSKSKAASPITLARERLRRAWAAVETRLGDAKGLRPGVDPDRNFVEEFAVTFDVDVPPEVVAFYEVHDGERDGKARVCPPRRLLSVDEIGEATFAEMQRREQATAAQLKRKARAPKTKVDPQCTAYGAYLLVITTVDTKGGFLAIDFEPSDSGTSGQIVEHSPNAIRFLASGIGEWLESLAS